MQEATHVNTERTRWPACTRTAPGADARMREGNVSLARLLAQVAQVDVLADL